MARRSKKPSKLDNDFVAPSKPITLTDKSHAMLHWESLKIYFEHWGNFNYIIYKSEEDDKPTEKWIDSVRDIDNVFRKITKNDEDEETARFSKVKYVIGLKKGR